MGYGHFLHTLFEDGRVTVAQAAEISAEEIERGDAVLIDFESRYRWEIPGDAPGVELPAARWAAVSFYRVCQFTVYRDVDEATMAAQLRPGYEAPATASTHYSVDLVLRFLPDLFRVAQQLSHHDPLMSHLMTWARAWPLSSVGIAKVGEVVIDGFADCPSMMTLYLDRILSAGDKARLSDPRVQDAARGALGDYRELAGGLAPFLRPPENFKETT